MTPTAAGSDPYVHFVCRANKRLRHPPCHMRALDGGWRKRLSALGILLMAYWALSSQPLGEAIRGLLRHEIALDRDGELAETAGVVD